MKFGASDKIHFKQWTIVITPHTPTPPTTAELPMNHLPYEGVVGGACPPASSSPVSLPLAHPIYSCEDQEKTNQQNDLPQAQTGSLTNVEKKKKAHVRQQKCHQVTRSSVLSWTQHT